MAITIEGQRVKHDTMNAVIIAVVVMLGLTVARVHVVLALLIGAIVGGLVGGLGMTGPLSPSKKELVTARRSH